MGQLSDFFNRSKFEARPLTSNNKEVKLDTLYSLELEVYDVLVLDTPAIVHATLATKKGREITILPTVVDVAAYGKFSYLFQFTIATGDWDESTELLLQLEITDHDSYVYGLDYQIKV